ncbi:MAG TPA: GTP 3',8-cyclase MoaA [Holophagaceae bacterium]|jgi:cyclic pyranopterin phosphate synthase|nr:GTP 3',8-cyclase MoaA [Holophagaceae bacterium]
MDGIRDTLGRPLRALRISVTDRCNFRCRYCMPAEVFGPDHAFLPKDQVLTFEEITRLAQVFASLGVTKLRLTGGEPLLRKDLPLLVAELAKTPGLQDLALTTNGALLAELAEPLRKARLHRLTVSLDTLDADRFRALCDTEVPLAKILNGLEVARDAGFKCIKLNCVVQRGVNDGEVEALAAFARERGLTLRFIEFMDVGTTNGWKLDAVVPGQELRQRIAARWSLTPVQSEADAVARTWRYEDGAGEVGFINSVTAPFCSGCDRARLSAEGRLHTCLFGAEGLDLRGALRSGMSDGDLAALVAARWKRRDDRYSELRSASTAGLKKPEMSYLGG